MIGRFASSRHPVVAARTIGGRGKGAVVGLGTAPCGGGFMAGLTTGRGQNMPAVLTGRRRAVVAA